MNITALMVTFNRLDKLKRCWAATQLLSFQHIFIVNNASTDGTKEWLNTIEDPRLTVLTPGQNLGGAGGFKLGAESLAAITSDWVVIYDDDAYPPVNLLDRFCVIVDEQWQIYCCKVVDTEGILCKMNIPYFHFPQCAVSAVKSMFTGMGLSPNDKHVQEVSSFSFVGAIIKKSLLTQTTEYIYSELFIYFDDLYYSYRLTLEGFRIRYSPELVFIHDVIPSSLGIQPSWKVYYLIRNLILSRYYFPKAAPYTIGALGIRILNYLLATSHQPDKRTYICYVLGGILDGVIRKTGKGHGLVRIV